MSFNATVKALQAEFDQQRWTGDENPAWGMVRTKRGMRQFLASIDAPHAELFHEVSLKPDGDHGQLTPNHLTAPCVLKPNGGVSGIGVMVLVPEGDTWRDPRTRTMRTFDDIQQLMAEVGKVQQWWRDDWLIEELLRPPAGAEGVVEYKCFTFGGRVELIMTHRAWGAKTRKLWRTPNWEPTNCGRIGDVIDPTLPMPSDPGGLLDLASAVANASPWAFMRVDVYDTDRGLIVGEVNATDGNPSFNPEWDGRMGAAWRRARGRTGKS